MNALIQILSAFGAAAILLAFFCLQQGRWRHDSRPYLWFNLVGAAFLSVVAVYDQRIGFILLEGAWTIVSLISILRLRRSLTSRSQTAEPTGSTGGNPP